MSKVSRTVIINHSHYLKKIDIDDIETFFVICYELRLIKKIENFKHVAMIIIIKMASSTNFNTKRTHIMS